MREFYKNLRRIGNTLTCSIRTIHIVTSDTLVGCDVLGTMFNVEHSIGELITFPGGIPLKSFDGTVIQAFLRTGFLWESSLLPA
jgi:hypothetical protein